jgi:hypothetical protein
VVFGAGCDGVGLAVAAISTWLRSMNFASESTRDLLCHRYRKLRHLSDHQEAATARSLPLIILHQQHPSNLSPPQANNHNGQSSHRQGSATPRCPPHLLQLRSRHGRRDRLRLLPVWRRAFRVGFFAVLSPMEQFANSWPEMHSQSVRRATKICISERKSALSQSIKPTTIIETIC